MSFIRANISSPVYTSAFASSENPFSDGGKFLQGFADGVLWQNTLSISGSPGDMEASGTSAGYNDCVCCLKPGFGISQVKHYSRGIVKKVTYTPLNSHEIELLVGWNISISSATGYEFDCGYGVAPQFVRWNGALGNFTVQGAANDNLATGKGWTDTPTGVMAALVDGDDVRVEYRVSAGVPTLKAYLNGVLTVTVSDTSGFQITSGNPGWGFFVRPVGTTITNFAWKTVYAAGF